MALDLKTKYAAVNEAGNITDYPLFEHIIKSRGHTLDMYAKVDESDKPIFDKYHSVSESMKYIPATNTVKVTYTRELLDPNSLLNLFNSVTPDKENPGDESKAVKYKPTSTDLEMLQKMVTHKVEKQLDKFAQERRYDTIHTLLTYLNSTDEQFKKEAQYAEQINSGVWRALTTYMNEVLAGVADMPKNYDEIQAKLPAITWDNFQE